MRDPHIHVERCIWLPDGTMRQMLAAVAGIATDAPKTVTTGCKRRRPYVMTSLKPEAVTCLACRQYAAEEYARIAMSLEGMLTSPVLMEHCKHPREQLQDWATWYHGQAALFSAI